MILNMKKMIPLIILLIIVIAIGAKIVENAYNMVEDANLKDLKTDMLLIQAKMKKCVEEVNFQKANVKDEARIEEIKVENLKGKKITSNVEVRILAESTNKIDMENIEEYYYLDEQDLADIGITDLTAEKNGYFIIRYYIDDMHVEVLNTKGYNGLYSLDDLEQISE